jgi:hypothetical protein
LLSNCTAAVAAVKANPKFVAGAVIHPCTSAVTSTVTYAPAWLTENTCEALCSEGSVAYVTLYSPHAPPSVCTLTNPAVSARLQYNRSTARDTCAAVVPVGNTPRSNCSSAVYPPPTFKFEIAPLLTAGSALFTCVSATSVGSTANAGATMAIIAATTQIGSIFACTRPINILRTGTLHHA